MKQKILDALKAKFQGVNESILGRIADKLGKTITNEEQITTAIEGVTFQQVLESYGDSRATEAQQTAVRNYETKYGLKDGAKIDQQKPKEDKQDDVPAWAQSILDANKQLSERIDKMDSDRTRTARRQQLDNITGKLPETYRKAYQRIDIDNITDEQFNALLTEVGTEVQGIMEEVKTKGAVFGRPAKTTGAAGNDGKLTEEQVKAISARQDAPKEGQPF